ncbi:uncharacterized protein [Oryctolagus cuniculus]|uniref:uncharacterized protein n=1 Tax=Oryctolagus cuniculus TaxID=9986 RepID=UPI00387A6C70
MTCRGQRGCGMEPSEWGASWAGSQHSTLEEELGLKCPVEGGILHPLEEQGPCWAAVRKLEAGQRAGQSPGQAGRLVCSAPRQESRVAARGSSGHKPAPSVCARGCRRPEGQAALPESRHPRTSAPGLCTLRAYHLGSRHAVWLLVLAQLAPPGLLAWLLEARPVIALKGLFLPLFFTGKAGPDSFPGRHLLFWREA